MYIVFGFFGKFINLSHLNSVIILAITSNIEKRMLIVGIEPTTNVKRCFLRNRSFFRHKTFIQSGFLTNPPLCQEKI